MHRTFVAAVVLALSSTLWGQQPSVLPNKDGSIKFAVIGDSGTGGSAQERVAKRLMRPERATNFSMIRRARSVTLNGSCKVGCRLEPS